MGMWRHKVKSHNVGTVGMYFNFMYFILFYNIYILYILCVFLKYFMSLHLMRVSKLAYPSPGPQQDGHPGLWR